MRLLLSVTVFCIGLLASIATTEAQSVCVSNIDPGLCKRAQAVFDTHMRELTSGNISADFERRLRNAPERPLEGTPCFFRYGADLGGVITKCIEPRHISNPKPDQPIILRANGLDACPSSGVVVGMNPKGDNYLSVRSGPSGNHREVDRLSSSEEVAVCDKSGDWLAVIYPRKVDSSGCGVSEPVLTNRRYKGPCEQGWVHRRYIRITAG